MNKTPQRERILQYIREHGSINCLQAAYEIGCLQLAARIRDLEKRGYRFNKDPYTATNRYGDTVFCKKYSVRIEPEMINAE